MTWQKAFLYSLIVAIFVGGLAAFGEKYFFPDWASHNKMLIAIAIGVILGPFCTILVRWGKKKE